MRRSQIVPVAAAALLVAMTAANAQQAPNANDDRAPAAGAAQPSKPQAQPNNAARSGSDVANQRRPSMGSSAQDMQDERRSRPAAREQSPRNRSQSTTGSGQHEPGARANERARHSGDRERRAVGRDNAKPDRNAVRERRRDESARDSGRVERGQSETTGQSSATDRDQAVRSQPSGRDRDTRADRGSRRDSISLSANQQQRMTARLSAQIDRLDVQPISRTRISASIGSVIPRSIRLYALPPDVVSIYPRFRGYSFVLVEDEYVIIEPRTRQIVTVIPASDSRRTSRETTGVAVRGEPLRLSPRARSVIRATVLREPACHYEQRIDFFLFVPVPRTVEVCEFPRRIVEEVPEIGTYRYVVRGEEVVVVDPDERRVVEIID
jgi:hypothetical protein